METGQIGDTTHLFDSKEERYFGQLQQVQVQWRISACGMASKSSHWGKTLPPDIAILRMGLDFQQ
jgi:hypothetical protein